MSGFEALDFSVAAPGATPHLALASAEQASFDATQGCWSVAATQGYVRCTLTLPDLGEPTPAGAKLHGVAIGAQLSSATPVGTVTVSVNGVAIMENYEPPVGSFAAVSWYVSDATLQAGQTSTGQIEIEIAPSGDGPLLLRSLSVMGLMLAPQLQTKWCWAAVASGVAGYFDNATTWTQCAVANACLGRADCCPNNANCNQAGELQAALAATGNLAAYAEGTQSLADLRAQISAGRPLGVYIKWKDGKKDGEQDDKGHFIVLSGVGPPPANGDAWTLVAVEDPVYGFSLMCYGTLTATNPKAGYLGDGTWNESYLTQPATKVGA